MKNLRPEPDLLQELPYDDDPLSGPSPKVSFMLKVRAVTFICISLEILLERRRSSPGAAVVSGSHALCP